MRRALLVLAAFAASTAVSAAAVLSSPAALRALDPSAAVTQSSWLAQVRSCSADWQAPDALFDQQCLGRLWRAAFESGSLDAFNQAMWEQQQRTPILASQCHEVGHETGRYAFSLAGSLDVLIRDASSRHSACDNGFVHGVMDGLGTSNPAEDELVQARRACEQLGGDARLICVDGSGHAFWQAVHEREESIAFCSAYASGTDQGTCFGGIVMQMFRDDTDGSRPAAARMEQAPEYMRALCRRMKQEPTALADACYTVAPRFLGFEAEQQTRAFSGAFGPDRQAQAPGSVEEVAQLWNEAAGRCSVFSPDRTGVALCRQRTAREAAGAARVPDLVTRLCGLLERDLQVPCRESGF